MSLVPSVYRIDHCDDDDDDGDDTKCTDSNFSGSKTIHSFYCIDNFNHKLLQSNSAAQP